MIVDELNVPGWRQRDEVGKYIEEIVGVGRKWDKARPGRLLFGYWENNEGMGSERISCHE
jgi:hypothetical protein